MRFRLRSTALPACALIALGALGAPRSVSAQPTSPGAQTAPAAARTASPQEIALARQTALEGLSAYRAGQFDKALSLFEQARAVYPSAQVLRMEGYSLLALERWEKAAESMEASLTSQIGPLDESDRADVKQQLEKALAHLGTVLVTSSVKGATLEVDDGEPRPLPLEKPVRLLEGKHWFKVRAVDHEDAEEEITVEGGKAIERTIDPKAKEKPKKEAPPPPKPPPPAPKGWFPGQLPVGIAVGSAGLALGGATLITALAGARIRSNVEADVATHTQNYGEGCDRGDYRLCMFDREVINRDADRADGLRDASVWMGIGAGVLVASGLTLVIFADHGPSASSKSGAAASSGAQASSGAGKPGTGVRVACGPAAAPGLLCTGSF